MFKNIQIELGFAETIDKPTDADPPAVEIPVDAYSEDMSPTKDSYFSTTKTNSSVSD